MIAGYYPQSAYGGMQKYVQAELTFVQQVVRDVGDKFGTIREVIHRSFIPSLLKETLPENDSLHMLPTLHVKSSGLALTYPVESSDENFRASEVTNSHIIQVTRGKDNFSLQDHRATTSKVKAEIKKQKEAAHKSALKVIINPVPRSLAHTLMRGTDTGTCLMVLPSVESTVIWLCHLAAKVIFSNLDYKNIMSS
jgi:hypothetical protein